MRLGLAVLSMPLLGALCLAGAAAFALAARGWPKSASRRLLAWLTLWLGMLVVPVHALGWAAALSRGNLLVTSLATSVVSLALALFGAPLRQRGEELASAAIGIVEGVQGLLGHAWRARHPVLIGCVLLPAFLLWSLLAVYVLPSLGWDRLVYHEPMIGWALQNGSFYGGDMSSMDLHVHCANIYPRMLENLGLWIVAIFDRRLVELPSLLVVPQIILAFYILGRHFGISRLTALGFGMGLFLVPAIVRQTGSVKNDGAFAAMFCVALAFCVVPMKRLRDQMIAALALGVLAGMKLTSVYIVPVVAAFALASSAFHAVRLRSAKLAAGAALAVVVVTALSAPSFLYSYHLHDNPLFPAEVDFAGIHFDGPGADLTNIASGRFLTRWALFDAWDHSVPGDGYGMFPAWVTLPLFAVGLLIAAWRGDRDRRAALLVIVTIAIGLTAYFSPALAWARYNVQIIAVVFLAAAYGVDRAPAFATGAVGILIFGGLLQVFWQDEEMDIGIDRVSAHLELTPRERAAEMEPWFPVMLALAREDNLQAGDLVLFERYPFPSTLWNERMSNRVAWLPHDEGGPSGWLSEAARRGAEWIVLREGGPAHLLAAERERWAYLGRVSVAGQAYVFYRWDGAYPPE